ncbi:TetR/AcrR family transcriptional regulator [Haematobacter genomosp. 1]|nr:TetR/AcrR family transcriptional regulator [Haematobacter genomosp. 1]
MTETPTECKKTENAAHSGRGRRRFEDGMDAATLAEATRADILANAKLAFMSNGFDGTSVNEIARNTQTSKRMIYYYFGSKDGLYRAVLEDAYSQASQARSLDRLDLLEPVEALKAYAARAFDNHYQNPDFVRLVMAENLNQARTLRDSPAISERTQRSLGYLDDVLTRGKQSGVFRQDCDLVDLYLVIISLSFYSISNQSTVAISLGIDMADPAQLDRRRALIVENALRFALRAPLEPA